MRILARIVLTSLLFVLPASAQKSSFTVEQVMSSPFPSSLTGAMQSPRVAWVFYNKGESNVWVADARGGFSDHGQN